MSAFAAGDMSSSPSVGMWSSCVLVEITPVFVGGTDSSGVDVRGSVVPTGSIVTRNNASVVAVGCAAVERGASRRPLLTVKTFLKGCSVRNGARDFDLADVRPLE